MKPVTIRNAYDITSMFNFTISSFDERHLESVANAAIQRLSATSTRKLAENELRSCIGELMRREAFNKALVCHGHLI